MKKSTLPLEDLFGADDRRLEVLRAIAQSGSISQAARSSGVSYKAAWQAVETLSNLAGVALVEKLVGGAGGGGASLTASGHELLRAADLLRSAQRQTLDHLRRGAATAGAVAAVGLRTSMRNQLPCKVRSLASSQGSVRVALVLPDGQSLSARITRESAQLLGLKSGLAVLALCKATAVTVAPWIEARAGVSLLGGTVARLSAGRGAREVSLLMPSGLFVIGFAEIDARLKRRQPAMAAIEESAVVLGRAG